MQRDLTLYYQGVDITDDVDIVECVMRDVCGGEKDLLSLKLDHAEKWFAWRPERNDTLRVTRAGYDTGLLYLNTVQPVDGVYRIFASGSKAACFEKRSAAYEDMTLGGVCALLAGEAGMASDFYQVDTGLVYDYFLRDEETPPEALRRLALLEGAALKAYNGQFLLIDIRAAQKLPAKHVVRLDEKLMDAKFFDRRDMTVQTVTVATPFFQATASGDGLGALTLTRLPACDVSCAFRWAENIMLDRNRRAQSLRLEMDFNAGYTAMARIDVDSDSAANGRWIIDAVEHDLLNGRTEALMARVI